MASRSSRPPSRASYRQFANGSFSSHSRASLVARPMPSSPEFARQCEAQARSDYFPLAEICEDFRNDPNRNLSFNDDFIAELLSTKKDDRDAYLILSLLYRHYPAICRYDVDHLHPAAVFDRLDLSTIPEDKRQYYSADTWDSILNLQLLYAGTNRAKQDDPLRLWLGQHPEYTRDPLMPKDSGYAFESFPAFVDERRGLLITAMKNL